VVSIPRALTAPPDRRALAARGVLQAMASGRASAVEMTARTLAAAEDCRRDLHAFSVIAHEAAMARARESDRRYREHRPRPLEGLSIAVKDMIDTKGIETRYGSAAHLGHVPIEDAAIVRRLKHAGAIIIGKTTTHEFAWGVTTASTAFGDTLNPRDPTRIPGGSSGGAAAAVGYGAVSVGLGTDTGGSVRIPAALCGTVGFKPSFAALSSRGIFPLASSLDHPGLLASSMDDLILLAGALGIAARPSADRPRLGVIRQIGPVPVEAAVADCFDRAVDRLGRSFAVSELSVGHLFDGAFAMFATIVLAEAGLVHLARGDEATIQSSYTAETRERIDRAKLTALGDYGRAQMLRANFTRSLTLFMDEFDYLVLPTCPCLAPSIGVQELRLGGWQGNVREALMSYTAPFNLAGLPAISIPLEGSASLPCGLQIVARKSNDGALLATAELVANTLA